MDRGAAQAGRYSGAVTTKTRFWLVRFLTTLVVAPGFAAARQDHSLVSLSESAGAASSLEPSRGLLRLHCRGRGYQASRQCRIPLYQLISLISGALGFTR